MRLKHFSNSSRFLIPKLSPCRYLGVWTCLSFFVPQVPLKKVSKSKADPRLRSAHHTRAFYFLIFYLSHKNPYHHNKYLYLYVKEKRGCVSRFKTKDDCKGRIRGVEYTHTHTMQAAQGTAIHQEQPNTSIRSCSLLLSLSLSLTKSNSSDQWDITRLISSNIKNVLKGPHMQSHH